ncbi:hypothetical protein VTL71DRAFT_11184 [Oculimacula yallundae]|uniref:Uncharacterized protein n=1 Tax=Oculimacula yallundae TaxID=86028 RepID=A0ABR4CVR0_9HELO
MSLDIVLSSLPKTKELSQVLSTAMGNTALLNSSTSHNIAKNNAVQVCGPVAGKIEHTFNLSLHYHAGGKDSPWRPIAGLNSNARISAFEQDVPSGAVEAPGIRSNLHNSRNEVFTVIATIDPKVDGNWIASRIIKRLNYQHQEAETRRSGPAIKGVVFEKTRIYVDLNCGGFEAGRRCKHRFYVVNGCKAFDVLLGYEVTQVLV